MKTPGDCSRQGGESPDEKKSVAIQKRAKRDQNLPEINQLCVVYEISLINLNTKISVLLKKNM